MDTKVYTLETTETEKWEEVLQRCGSYDVYHLPSYHKIAEEYEGHHASLFVCERESEILAFPMLFRPIEGLSGIPSVGYRDATSVYGYAGPVSTIQNPSEKIKEDFSISFRKYLEQNKVVAIFSRLHPLLDQEPYLANLGGEIRFGGQTIAIDLSLPLAVQRQQYRSNHKRNINKIKRQGIVCLHDQEWNYFEQFMKIYYETMARTHATAYYFFERSYFMRLREALDEKLHLFVALEDEKVLSGALFTTCHSIIQYHLGGTDSDYLKLAPSKLIFDTVRQWGTEKGARLFHLGGGVGSKEDSLFRFKAGFSPLRFQFKTWRMIVNQAVYNQLSEQKRAWNKTHGLEAASNDYFPAYRCPTKKI